MSAVIRLRQRQPPPGEKPVMLRTKEAAARLGVSPRTVERWVSKGDVPHVRMGDTGRIVRFPVELLDAWWQERTEGGR